ncbi:unnamed protein product [Peniophora sp. CBMAI 1063]|nr:unnamed protein product [Peniophora sp. CBMAI 1063]
MLRSITRPLSFHNIHALRILASHPPIKGPPTAGRLGRNVSTSAVRNATYRRFGDRKPEPIAEAVGGGTAPRSRPRLRYQILMGLGGAAGLYYVTHLERVPETGRLRFMDISPKFEEMLWSESYGSMVNEYRGKILPPNHPLVRRVHAVASRILEANNLGTLHAVGADESMSMKSILFGRKRDASEGWDAPASSDNVKGGLAHKEWHLIVVNDPKMVNAAAAPGSIVVFTGILPVVQDDEHLAAVLGHEVAHVVLRHSAESMSSMRIAFLIALAIDLMVGAHGAGGLLTSLIMNLPNSRKKELEADQVGLRLAANACFDPKAAPEVFERLGELERKMGMSGMDILQTHPASDKRVQALKARLPEGYSILSANPSCAETRSHFTSFKEFFRSSAPAVQEAPMPVPVSSVGASFPDVHVDHQERPTPRNSRPPLPSSVSELDLRFVVQRVRMERPPSDDSERRAYITEAVKKGEALFTDPNPLPAAVYLYRALRAHPDPSRVLETYRRQVPEPVYAVVVRLAEMT